MRAPVEGRADTAGQGIEGTCRKDRNELEECLKRFLGTRCCHSPNICHNTTRRGLSLLASRTPQSVNCQNSSRFPVWSLVSPV